MHDMLVWALGGTDVRGSLCAHLGSESQGRRDYLVSEDSKSQMFLFGVLILGRRDYLGSNISRPQKLILRLKI